MEIQQYTHPIPHVIIDNFLSDFQEVSHAVKVLQTVTTDGTHEGHYYEGLHRKEVYLHKVEGKLARPAMYLKETFLSQFWALKPKFEQMIFPFPMLNTTALDGIFLGYYSEGHKYSLHTDNGLVTSVLYLHQEMDFKGGDFILTNIIHGDNFRESERITIESKPNRMVLFPACYKHGVTPVEGEGTRIALTYLTTLSQLF